MMFNNSYTVNRDTVKFLAVHVLKDTFDIKHSFIYEITQRKSCNTNTSRIRVTDIIATPEAKQGKKPGV